MDARDVIKRPVITERSMSDLENRKYTFEVDVKANKTQVKQAVEEIFGVKVEKVNIMNYKGKFKRMVDMQAIQTNAKAIVTLTEDNKEIEIFQV